jgi:hypothetical protein
MWLQPVNSSTFSEVFNFSVCAVFKWWNYYHCVEGLFGFGRKRTCWGRGGSNRDHFLKSITYHQLYTNNTSSHFTPRSRISFCSFPQIFRSSDPQISVVLNRFSIVSRKQRKEVALPVFVFSIFCLLKV